MVKEKYIPVRVIIEKQIQETLYKSHKLQELIEYMSEYNYFPDTALQLAKPANRSVSSPVEQHAIKRQDIEKRIERLVSSINNDIQAIPNASGYYLQLNICSCII